MKVALKKEQHGKDKQQRKFKIDCYPYIFSDEELEILQATGYRLRALDAGTEKPVNSEERKFVKVCKGKAEPFSIMEVAWLKYLNRREIEQKMRIKEDDYEEYQAAIS